MRILVVILFMLLPFALSAVFPPLQIHAHEMAQGDDHGHGHGHHHHHKGDCPKHNDGDKKTAKFHSHDGQAPEYFVKEYSPLKQEAKAALIPPRAPKVFASRNIKPPLEPPAAA